MHPTPIFHQTEVEAAMAETVSKFASETILPKVREMDEAEKMDPAIVEQLFEQGLMGIEIPEKYGGVHGGEVEGLAFGRDIVCIIPAIGSG